jgi:hypothetical protein
MVSAIDRRVEEYRREAAAARIRAANDPAHRKEFLHVAENWEALAREIERLGGVFRQGNEAARL